MVFISFSPGDLDIRRDDCSFNCKQFALRRFVGADNHLHIFGVGYGVFLFIIRKENHLIVTYDPIVF